MLACWANSPDERPDFTKLCEELSDVLQSEAGHVRDIVLNPHNFDFCDKAFH